MKITVAVFYVKQALYLLLKQWQTPISMIITASTPATNATGSKSPKSIPRPSAENVIISVFEKKCILRSHLSNENMKENNPKIKHKNTSGFSNIIKFY